MFSPFASKAQWHTTDGHETLLFVSAEVKRNFEKLTSPRIIFWSALKTFRFKRKNKAYLIFFFLIVEDKLKI